MPHFVLVTTPVVDKNAFFVCLEEGIGSFSHARHYTLFLLRVLLELSIYDEHVCWEFLPLLKDYYVADFEVLPKVVGKSALSFALTLVTAALLA